MTEIDFDAVASFDLAGYASAPIEEFDASSPPFHGMIHSPPPHPLFQSSHTFEASYTSACAQTDRKASTISASRYIMPSLRSSGSGGSAQVEGTYSWGSDGEGSWSIGASAEAHDSNGNYIEGHGNRNSDGSGSVGIGAGSRQ